MIKWEYKEFVRGIGLIESLNIIGEDGWEVVKISERTEGYDSFIQIIAKRCISLNEIKTLSSPTTQEYY
jgi:hypothetical protein